MIRQATSEGSQPHFNAPTMRGEDALMEYQHQIGNIMFDSFFGTWPYLFSGGLPSFFYAGRTDVASPAPDTEPDGFWSLRVSEKDREIIISAEVPGFDKDEVDAQISKGLLKIKAEKRQKADGGQLHIGYDRTIPLPTTAEVGEAETEYRDGVLEIHIPMSAQPGPKSAPTSKPASNDKAPAESSDKGVSSRPAKKRSTAKRGSTKHDKKDRGNPKGKRTRRNRAQSKARTRQRA